MAAIWSAVRLQPHRECFALNQLARVGFETYCPRVLHRRYAKGKKIETTPLLFPGYAFVLIVMQWYSAHYAPGVIGFLMDGERPARVPDVVIDQLRAREHNGIIQLPKQAPLDPRAGFRINERLRIKEGAFRGLFGLYAGMAPRDRIKVLMDLLGGHQEVEMAVSDVTRVHM